MNLLVALRRAAAARAMIAPEPGAYLIGAQRVGSAMMGAVVVRGRVGSVYGSIRLCGVFDAAVRIPSVGQGGWTEHAAGVRCGLCGGRAERPLTGWAAGHLLASAAVPADYLRPDIP